MILASRKAEFLACPSDADALHELSMDEFGSEYFPTLRKGRRLVFRSIKDSSNVRLATSIPFAGAAITIWTINQLYLKLHTNFRFYFSFIIHASM